MALVEKGTVPKATHPHEMRADFDMRVGKHISMTASARVTPVGVVSAGVAVALMTLALGYAAGTFWRRR